MKATKFLAKVSVIALAAAANLTPGYAQPTGKTSLYVYHTRSSAGCPGLDWHIMTEPDGKITGFVAWDRMTHMARLNGTINNDRTFKMDAQEVDGSGRRAVVSGTAAGEYVTAEIHGSGTACDDKPLQVPRFTGGLEGGGG